MKHIVIIILFLLTGKTYAVWSAFAHVTPETEQKYEIKVSLTPVEGQKGKFVIQFNAVASDYKHAWLVHSSEKLSEKEQNLRSYMWGFTKPTKDILIQAKLLPANTGRPFHEEGKPIFYKVVLDSKFIKNSYIYIDFPEQVHDGGYYYSIDLGAYFTKHEKSNT